MHYKIHVSRERKSSVHASDSRVTKHNRLKLALVAKKKLKKIIDEKRISRCLYRLEIFHPAIDLKAHPGIGGRIADLLFVEAIGFPVAGLGTF